MLTRTRISVRLIPVKRAVDPGTSRKAKPRFSPWQLGGLSVKELLKRVWKSANEDDIFGRSAQLAYYFFLALFPALIFLTATLGLLAASGKRLHDTLLGYMAFALPAPVYQLVKSTLEQTTAASGGGKLTFGLIAALWTACSGMSAVQDTLNAVYNVRDPRPLWKSSRNRHRPHDRQWPPADRRAGGDALRRYLRRLHRGGWQAWVRSQP